MHVAQKMCRKRGISAFNPILERSRIVASFRFVESPFYLTPNQQKESRRVVTVYVRGALIMISDEANRVTKLTVLIPLRWQLVHGYQIVYTVSDRLTNNSDNEHFRERFLFRQGTPHTETL